MRSFILRRALLVALACSIPCTAAATGMIARTFSRPDAVFHEAYALATHPRGVLLAARCATPGVSDAVHLYEPEGDEPVLTLTEPGGRYCSTFGTAVASLGNEILIGAPRPRNGSPTAADGAVYVFDGTTGALLRTIESPASGENGARFGNVLLVSGADLFVAAPGVGTTPFGRPGVVYRIDAATGAVLGVYPNPEPTFATGFGAALAVTGDRLLVGDPDGPNFIYDGVVQVFDIPSGAHLATLTPPSPAPDLTFGTSLAVAGGRIAVGTPLGPGGLDTEEIRGVVHLFDAASFAHVGTVGAPEVSPFGTADFGRALGVLGTDLLVGAPVAPIGHERSGAAYLIDPADGEVLARFHAPGAGMSLAAVGGRVLVGARFQGEHRNLAYLFETCASLADGAACDDGDGCVTGDTCAGGRCVAGTSAVVCEGNPAPCRLRGCDPATGACQTKQARFEAPCFEPPYECPDASFCDETGACVPDSDPDPDRDLVCSALDICPQVANPSQLDSDGDERGDVCDPSDASLVVHAASVRWNRGGTPETGRVSMRGELLSRADLLAFDSDAGALLRVEDEGGFTQVFVWPDEECGPPESGRFGCEHRGRPDSRFELRALARQVDGRVLYRFALQARALDIEQPPEGPLDITLTTQPARAVSGYDRVGRVTGCRAGRTRVTCRISAGAP
jgi:hypothetical protein